MPQNDATKDHAINSTINHLFPPAATRRMTQMKRQRQKIKVPSESVSAYKGFLYRKTYISSQCGPSAIASLHLESLVEGFFGFGTFHLELLQIVFALSLLLVQLGHFGRD